MTLSNNSTPSQSIEIVDPEGSCKKDNLEPVYRTPHMPIGIGENTINRGGLYSTIVGGDKKKLTKYAPHGIGEGKDSVGNIVYFLYHRELNIREASQ